MRSQESRIQQACVKWFDYQYPELSMVLFAVPNGGKRYGATGAILTLEGVRSGVSDLILLVADKNSNALCIEMKTARPKTYQRPNQKIWQKAAESAGNRYEVVRSVDEFMELINSYLK